MDEVLHKPAGRRPRQSDGRELSAQEQLGLLARRVVTDWKHFYQWARFHGRRVIHTVHDLAGGNRAKVEDRPGVTRSKQWVPIDRNLELLDTPGILWPKFDDQSVGMNLAYTGAVKDDILDVETLGCHLMAYLGEHYPDALKTAYKLSALPEREAEENDIAYGYRLLEAAGKKRGFLISGGEVDTERMAKILLDEFRSGKLGRFTLELP